MGGTEENGFKQDQVELSRVVQGLERKSRVGSSVLLLSISNQSNCSIQCIT